MASGRRGGLGASTTSRPMVRPSRRRGLKTTRSSPSTRPSALTSAAPAPPSSSRPAARIRSLTTVRPSSRQRRTRGERAGSMRASSSGRPVARSRARWMGCGRLVRRQCSSGRSASLPGASSSTPQCSPSRESSRETAPRIEPSSASIMSWVPAICRPARASLACFRSERASRSRVSSCRRCAPPAAPATSRPIALDRRQPLHAAARPGGPGGGGPEGRACPPPGRWSGARRRGRRGQRHRQRLAAGDHHGGSAPVRPRRGRDRKRVGCQDQRDGGADLASRHDRPLRRTPVGCQPPVSFDHGHQMGQCGPAGPRGVAGDLPVDTLHPGPVDGVPFEPR
jgi:hypothetical protein